MKNSPYYCPGRGANPRPPAHPDFITSKESHALLVRPQGGGWRYIYIICSRNNSYFNIYYIVPLWKESSTFSPGHTVHITSFPLPYIFPSKKCRISPHLKRLSKIFQPTSAKCLLSQQTQSISKGVLSKKKKSHTRIPPPQKVSPLKCSPRMCTH